MRQLHLIRHAKSAWDAPSLSDHDRPLNARGRRAAPLMGRAFAARVDSPPVFFVSTAQRAQETFAGFAEGWVDQLNPEVHSDRELYTFDPRQLMDWLCCIDDDLDNIAVIGHNPAMTDFANYLCPEIALANLPTAGWLWLGFEDTDWQSVVQSSGRAYCHTLCTPKSLGGSIERTKKLSEGWGS